MLEWFIKGWFILESEDTLFEEGGEQQYVGGHGGVKYCNLAHATAHKNMSKKNKQKKEKKTEDGQVPYALVISSISGTQGQESQGTLTLGTYRILAAWREKKNKVCTIR